MTFENSNRSITHWAGTFVIDAHGAFLNGKGTEKRNVGEIAVPKYFVKGGVRYPYISVQAFKHWMKEVAQWHIGNAPQHWYYAGKKVVGPCDDLFGYFRVRPSKAKSKVPGENKAEVRLSPVLISQLMPITGVRTRTNYFSNENGFVHFQDGTSLPYSTRFYNVSFVSIFTIDLDRVGVFRNVRDRIEVDIESQDRMNGVQYVEVAIHDGKEYQLTDLKKVRGNRLWLTLKSLATITGGAKMSQFGCDIAPKAIISAGLTCGNNPFNGIFRQEAEGISLDLEALSKRIAQYEEIIATPVYLAIRKGFLINDAEVRQFSSNGIFPGTISPIRLTTPGALADLAKNEITKRNVSN